MTETKLIEARATIHLAGLRAGKVAIVDTGDEYTRMLLDTQKLVPTKTLWPPAEAPPAAE